MTQDHYFTVDPSVASHPATTRLELPDLSVDMLTDRGVFAHAQVDRGTDLLLRTIPSPPGGDLLDLGCGYGPIALTLALRNPVARVWAVDVNRRALTLCQRNAENARATNISIAEPDQVPAEIRFAAMYSNPPVRLGKESLHRLLASWLARLRPAGHAYLVIQRHLGSDSLARWLSEQGHSVERIRSRMGYRVLAVHSLTASTHDEAP